MCEPWRKSMRPEPVGPREIISEERKEANNRTANVCRGLRCRNVKVHGPCIQIHTHTITHTHTHTRLQIHTYPSCSPVNGRCHQKTNVANAEHLSQVGFEVPYLVKNTPQQTAINHAQTVCHTLRYIDVQASYQQPECRVTLLRSSIVTLLARFFETFNTQSKTN